MFPVTTRVAQTRLVFEVLKSDKDFETAYAESRSHLNAFLETHKTSTSLDICFKDIKDRTEKVDTLDDLILKLSFEEEFKAAIIFLEDAGEWTKTVGLAKSADSPNYVLIDPESATIHHCKTLDFDVEKMLQEPKAPFGYILVQFKKIVPPEGGNNEEEKLNLPPSGGEVQQTKKRHKPIVPTKKKRGATSTVDMTSEESTNK